MASLSEENLHCPICYGIFKDPVVLLCSHSFCKACWQQCRRGKAIFECPVCKTQSSLCDPPRNLALKNLCEDFLLEEIKGLSLGPANLCSLHAEKLKLFCVDHQQPVCVICLHSNSHSSHSFRPIDEAAQDSREKLKALLKPSQEKLELFNDAKRNFDQAAEDIEVQAQDTERQIKGVFSMLQKFFQKEAWARIGAVREEKKQKGEMMKRRSEALSREIAALSDTVRATEEVLQAEDLPFLQSYKTAAEIAQQSLLDVPQPVPGGLIDMTKHLDNLPFKILDRMKEMISTAQLPD